ncbi:MAG: glycerophosphodiester phosphodiesterase family protein [Bacteroidota bacterium]
MKTLEEFVQSDEVLVVAHRGSSGTAPENTLSSLNEALKAGAKMVEIDVQLTADKHAVVFHDSVLGRTTNGSGKIHNTFLKDVQQLDAGSWFGESYKNEKIPLLNEALELLKGRAYVNIEIKPPQTEENFGERLEKILGAVFQSGMEQHVLFSSFHHPSLALLKEKFPQLHTAAIQVPNDKRLPSEIAREIGCRGFVCSLREITKKRADDALKNGMYVGVYTINSEEDLQKVRQYGVKAIVTNFPEKIIRAHAAL